jgi:hypothetical protein
LSSISDHDRVLLGLLGVVALYAWWSSLPKGIGRPGIGTGKGEPRNKPPSSSSSTSSTRKPLPITPGSGGLPGAGRTGPPILEIDGPRVITPEQYKAQQAARAKKKP